MLTWLLAPSSFGSDLDTIGITLLRATTTNLNGTGVRVAHPEGPDGMTTPPPFEVNPGAAGVGLPVSRFTYFTNSVPVNTFPNSIGAESSHADGVASLFYGLPSGVSTNVLHIDNYEANYFLNSVVNAQAPINGRVVNQSFITDTNNQSYLEAIYDQYVVSYNTLFVSAIGNTGPVSPPSTAYNVVGVAAFGGASTFGPTPDGRAKPDLTAPGGATSFSTPLVAGSGAILLQAGTRGDGGSDTNSATDARTVKALLLNGAVKPLNWTNSSSSSLDARYGTGVLNVFNSYKQLAGGKHAFIASTLVATNNPHPPTTNTANVNGLTGWDFNTITSSSTSDAVNHYCFSVTNGAAGASFAGDITLVWYRQGGQNNINNLDLFLYDMATSNLVATSTSLVDNVEHIYVTQLPPGRYDLEVFKKGGAGVSDAETYALAYEFFSVSLTLARAPGFVTLSWPVYPAGFVLQSTPTISPSASWSDVGVTPLITNYQNRVTVASTNGLQSFRLIRKP